MDINNPATWKFLAGIGVAGTRTLSPEDNAQHVAGLGANGSYIPTKIDDWTYTGTYPNGLTHRQNVLRFAQTMRQAGGLVYAQMYPATSWHMDADWALQAQNQRECINDTPAGQQSEYINWARQTIAELQPDLCSIINEVRGDNFGSGQTEYGSDQFWRNYIAFCNRFMVEMNAVSPNMTFILGSIPFWNLNEIVPYIPQFVAPSGCRIVYSFHHYFALQNVPQATETDTAYWNNGATFSSGQRENAKNISYTELLNKRGIQALLNQGKSLIFDEFGTNLRNPNWVAWMEDTQAFCNQRGIGTNYLCSTYVSGTGWNQSPASFWGRPDLGDNVNSWVPNDLAIAWQNIMGGAGLALPFHDSFASLNNWTPINGTWSTP